MKQVLISGEKGYLIQKKVVEGKLREKFEVLKDKEISSLDEEYSSCKIRYEPKPKIERKKDYAIVYNFPEAAEKDPAIITKSRSGYCVFKKEILNELFGLKGNIFDITLKVIKNGKITGKRHYYFRINEYGLFDEKDTYYFFKIKDYETEDICEMK